MYQVKLSIEHFINDNFIINFQFLFFFLLLLSNLHFLFIIQKLKLIKFHFDLELIKFKNHQISLVLIMFIIDFFINYKFHYFFIN